MWIHALPEIRKHGYISLDLGTSAHRMMPSRALEKLGRIYTTYSRHSSKKWAEIAPCKSQCRSARKLSAVGTLEFFTIPTTYHSDLCKKCTVKVEFLYQNYTLFSRYLRLKFHIALPNSNLVALNHAYEYWQLIWTFNDDAMGQKNEMEIKGVQPLLSLMWFKPEEAMKGDSMAIQNCCRRLALRSVFGLLSVIKGAPSVQKIETVLERGWWLSRKLRNTVLMQRQDKRRAALEIVVADSRGGAFSALA
jgi:hypothetical protein